MVQQGYYVFFFTYLDICDNNQLADLVNWTVRVLAIFFKEVHVYPVKPELEPICYRSMQFC